MRRCSGTTRDGHPCSVSVDDAQTFCHLHDPARASERRRSASRAGKAKSGSVEVRTLKTELRQLKDDVLAGRVERNDASVVVQILRTLRDYIELERRMRTRGPRTYESSKKGWNVDNRRLRSELDRLRQKIGPSLCEERACTMLVSTELIIHPDGTEEHVGNPPPPLCDRCPHRSDPNAPVRHIVVVRRVQS